MRRALLAPAYNSSPRLAPDGSAVAFVRNTDEGPELWLRTAAADERRLAAHPGETIDDLRWTADGTMLVYRHSPSGRNEWSLAAARPTDTSGDGGDTGPARYGTPGPVTEYWLSRHDPTTAVYSCRRPGASGPELFRLSLNASLDGGEPVLVAREQGFRQWFVDPTLQPRGGIRTGGDGSVEIVLGDRLETARGVLRIGAREADDLSVQAFSADGRRLFLLTSYDSKTRRLISIGSTSGATMTVFAHPTLDVDGYPIAGDGVWFEPATGLPDICAVTDQRLRYHALNPAKQQAVGRLAATGTGSAVIVDRSADDRTWLIGQVRDDGPVAYHVFEPTTGRSEPLFLDRPDLADYQLPKLEDFIFVAGDGRELTGYAMRPVYHRLPLPTVVVVHDGPTDRESWRFHAEAQYLASLGYLSLHINHRGSRGFGVEFRRAGNHEYGGRMQQDLYDAVAHGVQSGLVDRDRVAFFGTSYGGHAALLAAYTRSDLVRCAVALSDRFGHQQLATADRLVLFEEIERFLADRLS
ncbi:prolyl oligopeptidase family serine peptidase [Micromonospora sp. NPDC049523]|uniref:S9 family peptidase n=1 Tax=Micromonospora sp. NPDC049523 TaxID=3155921 RepID=UPI003414EF80